MEATPAAPHGHTKQRTRPIAPPGCRQTSLWRRVTSRPLRCALVRRRGGGRDPAHDRTIGIARSAARSAARGYAHRAKAVNVNTVDLRRAAIRYLHFIAGCPPPRRTWPRPWWASIALPPTRATCRPVSGAHWLRRKRASDAQWVRLNAHR